MLRINDLYFGYDKTVVVDKLNLNVEKNEIISILGDSGSGKSTLLRLISGLEEVEKGKIILGGVDITNTLPEKRNVGMVFQDYALFPHLNVLDNIAFSLKNKDDCIIKPLLEITNMGKYIDRYPHQLSGGEKQRVALARALAHRPKVLLLDEPFSNLDTELKSSLRKEVKEILSAYSITTILVTHDIEDAKTISNKIYFMSNGKISEKSI